MAEVVGVLASIAQLIDLGTKLSIALAEAIRTVRHGAELLRARSQQIARLIDTAVTVQQNQDLHTALICRQLRVVLAEAEALLSVLRAATSDCTIGSLQKRFWIALRNQKEKSILQAFDRLEKEKATLILCVNLASADKLSSLHRSMDLVFSKISKKRHRNSRKKSALPKVTSETPRLESALVPLSMPPQNSNGYASRAIYNDRSVGIEQFEPSATDQQSSCESMDDGHKYNKVVLADSKLITGDRSGEGGNHKYDDWEITGESRTILGNSSEAAKSGRHVYNDLRISGGSKVACVNVVDLADLIPAFDALDKW